MVGVLLLLVVVVEIGRGGDVVMNTSGIGGESIGLAVVDLCVYMEFIQRISHVFLIIVIIIIIIIIINECCWCGKEKKEKKKKKKSKRRKRQQQK